MKQVNMKKTGRAPKPRVYLRVTEGGLVPADQYAASQLRDKNYQSGDVVSAELTKLNNPELHRRLFAIAQLCIASIAAFRGMSPRQALRRLQWEANVACEEMEVAVSATVTANMRFPLSLAYDAMDHTERQKVERALCRHIARSYRPELTAQQVAHLAARAEA